MSSPGERVPLKRPSLNRERNSVSKWCDLWGMKLNENALTVDGTGLKETDDLVILGVSFDSKIALRTSLFPELQLRGLVSYETQSEFIVVAMLRMIGIHPSSVEGQHRLIIGFPIISDYFRCRKCRFPYVGPRRKCQGFCALKSSEFRLKHVLRNSLSMYFH